MFCYIKVKSFRKNIQKIAYNRKYTESVYMFAKASHHEFRLECPKFRLKFKK